MNGRLVGSLIGASFGTAFLVANSGDLPAPWPTVVKWLALLAAATCVALLWVHRDDIDPTAVHGDPFRGRLPLIIVGEVIALFGGAMILDRVFGLGEAGVAWVATVVGLHFLPMGWLSGLRFFYGLGAVMTTLGVCGLALAVAGAPTWTVSCVAGVCSGVAMLVSTIRGILQGQSRQVAA